MADRRHPPFAQKDWAGMNFAERLRKKADDEECTEICWQPGNDGIIVRNTSRVEKCFPSFKRTMYNWGFLKQISPRTKNNHVPPSRENKTEEYWHHRENLFIREDAANDFALLRTIKYVNKAAKSSNASIPKLHPEGGQGVPSHSLRASQVMDDNTARTVSVSSDSRTSSHEELPRTSRRYIESDAASTIQHDPKDQISAQLADDFPIESTFCGEREREKTRRNDSFVASKSRNVSLSDQDMEEVRPRLSKRKSPSECQEDNNGCNVAHAHTAIVDEKVKWHGRHAEATRVTNAEKSPPGEVLGEKSPVEDSIGSVRELRKANSNLGDEMSVDSGLTNMLSFGDRDKEEESIALDPTVLMPSMSESPCMHIIPRHTTVNEQPSRTSTRFWFVVTSIFDAHYESAVRHANQENRNDINTTQECCDLRLATMSYAAFADQLDLLGKISYLTLTLPYAASCQARTNFFRKSSPRRQRADFHESCDGDNGQRRAFSSENGPFGSFNIHTFVRDEFPKNVPDKMKGESPSPSRQQHTKDDTCSDFSLHRDWFQKKLQDLLSAHHSQRAIDKEDELPTGVAALDTLTEQLESLHRITFGGLPEGPRKDFESSLVETLFSHENDLAELNQPAVICGANDSLPTQENAITWEASPHNMMTSACFTTDVSTMTEKPSAPRSSTRDTAEQPHEPAACRVETEKQAPRFSTRAIAPMQQPRQAFAAITIREEGEIVVLGGFHNTTPVFTVESASIPRTGTVSSSSSSLPQQKWGYISKMKERWSFGAAIVMKRSGGHEPLTMSVDGFPPPSHNRSHQVIVAGGACDDNPMNSTEMLNLSTNKWVELPPLQYKRNGCAVTSVYSSGVAQGTNDDDGRVFVVGGSDGGSYHDTVEWLDASTEDRISSGEPGWRLLPHKMKQGRYFCAAVMIHSVSYAQDAANGKSYAGDTVDKSMQLVVLGGLLPGKRATNTVECFDFAASEWHDLPPMNQRRAQCAAAAIGCRIFVVGGTDEGFLPLATVEYFDFQTCSWTLLHAELSVPRMCCAAVVTTENRNDACHDRLVVLGGGQDEFDALSSVEVLEIDG